MDNLIQAIVNFFKSLFSMSKPKTKTQAKPKPASTSKPEKSKSEKKTLYALMVAIDRYNKPVPPLRGCVNDRDAMKDYLERQFANQDDVKLQIKTVTDDEATKQGVINAFKHFDRAGKDDICLFYFSGHGSQSPSPKEFLHLDPDGMNESLVCYDSRNGAKDLMDKELSYLIWKATNKNNPHFIAIFDCCNSGTITRNATMTVRQAPAAPYPTRFQEYFGHENYKIDKQSDATEFLSPPRGRYIQLSACKEQETAKETQIDGQPRGIFTYNLVQVLEQNGGNISYAELQQILQMRVGNQVRDQFPQLITTEPNDKSQRFLGGTIPAAAPNYLIQYSKGKWLLNAGLVQGIPAQGGKVELEDGSKVKLTKVLPNQSEVDRMDGKDVNQSYKAFAKGLEFKQMKLAFAPDANNDGKRVLSKTFDKYPSPVFEIVKDAAEAAYWIRCVDSTFRLTLPDDDRPVFKRVEGYTESSALAFISHTEKVANWGNLLELSNPKTSIKDSDIGIEFYRVTEPGNEEDNAPSEQADWRKRIVLRYEKANGDWKRPAVRMRVRNNGNRTLYFSTLNMMDNFAISNRFMPLQELQPGEDAWLLDVFEGKSYRTIPLEIEDSYHTWGITEAKEYFKLIISTDPYLKTDNYNQEGLELDINPEDMGVKRAGRTSSNAPEQPDWTTREIEMLVVRPMEQQSLASGGSVDLMDAVKVTAPRGMSASVALGTVNEAERSLSESEAYPELTFSPKAMRSTSQSFEFTPGNHNSPGLSVMELSDIQGREMINAENPLAVRIQKKLHSDEMIIPMGYDPETKLYYPLGHATQDGVLQIEMLPEVSPTGTRSLFGSVKIFFQKVILSKLGLGYDYPQLAVAKFDDSGENFDYITNVKEIRLDVTQAKKIAIFVHGIIGDTTQMPQMVHRIQSYNGDPFHNPFDLVLTFDYENLQTEIQQTAKDFKAKLEAIGLKSGHDKDVTIIAHSMGGLVSRWMIEKEGGNEIINRLIQVGTPNFGSPWSDVYQLSTALLTQAVNGAAFLQPYILMLHVMGRFAGQLFKTLEQMDPDDSKFLKQLNDGTDPGIPYTIVAGNTRLIPVPEAIAQAHASMMRRVLERFRKGGNVYKVLDSFLFKEPNDIAVSVDSIYGITGAEQWQTRPKQISVGCDHISYFVDPLGLEGLAQALFEK